MRSGALWLIGVLALGCADHRAAHERSNADAGDAGGRSDQDAGLRQDDASAEEEDEPTPDADTASDGGPASDGGSSPDAGPDCAAVTCGEHQHCAIASNDTECVCDDGYAGASCDACADGFQDLDRDGQCQPACLGRASDCSGRGSCDDSSGELLCTCEVGTTGASCQACAAGYVADGDACTWSGVVQDPTFDGAGWVTTGGATTERGWAELDTEAACFGGTVTQQVQLPAYTETTPLVLRFQARRASNDHLRPAPGVSVNGVMYRAEIEGYGTGWTDNTVCIGEGAYGREVEIAFLSFEVERNCEVDGFHIDNARIEPAQPGECPTPEQPIPNPDFTQSDMGWVPRYLPSTGMFTVGNGELVMTGSVCGGLEAVGQAWLPTILPGHGLALEVAGTGPTGSGLFVKINDREIGVIEGSGSTKTNRVCIPEWASGSAATLSFATTTAPVVGSLVDCSVKVSFTVREIALVDAAECFTDQPQLQPGFERFGDPLLVSPWLPTLNSNAQVPASTVDLINDSAVAFAGDSALRLRTPHHCQEASARASLSVPAATDDLAGPALVYAYRFDNVGPSNPRAEVCVSNDCEMLTKSMSWSTRSRCIDPVLSGRQTQLVLRLLGGDGLCSDEDNPAPELWFDEVQLVLDPGCPTH